MKVAILHDYFDKTGGGERLVLNLAKALNADIYTGFIDREKTFDTAGVKIISLGVGSGGNILYRNRKIQEKFSKLRLHYDFYIFSGVWCISAAENHHPNVLYLHTVPRFAYDLREYYSNSMNPVSRIFFNRFVDAWRPGFEENMKHIDRICANSENVRNRLLRYVGSGAYKKSTAVYTGFDTGRFHYKKDAGFYLSTSRLDRLKRIDVVIDAFRKNGRQLIVASSGPDEKRLKRLAEGCSNIRFVGRVSDERLRGLYATCRATIEAAVDEDLGLVPLESHASGKPCIAVKEGGFAETITEKTGVFFEPNADSLNRAIEKAEKIKWNPRYIISTAKKYDTAVFTSKIVKIIKAARK